MATDPNLADRLRALRTAKGFTQTDLAYKSGVSYTTISKLENAHHTPTKSTLVALAAALEVPAAELLRAASVAPGDGAER